VTQQENTCKHKKTLVNTRKQSSYKHFVLPNVYKHFVLPNVSLLWAKTSHKERALQLHLKNLSMCLGRGKKDKGPRKREWNLVNNI
jgi:hypothetical protein